MRRTSHETPNQDGRRARAAARLRGAARVLIGKDPLPSTPRSAPSEAQQERRIPQQKLETIRLTPGKSERMHAQRTDIPEYVGKPDKYGNNVVLTFDLPGDEGPINFSVLRRQDGRGPVHSAKGWPPEWRTTSRRESPTITVMPTEMLPWLDRMNDPEISKEEFGRYSDSMQRGSVTVQAGNEAHIGREHHLGEFLGMQTSNDHLTIGLTERAPGSAQQDATVYFEDHSSNGTDNVVQQRMVESYV